MQKAITTTLVVVGLMTGMASAQAASPKEIQYIKAIKAAKLANLKTNTNAELINIGKTLCIDVTYGKDYLTKLYKDNHFVWDPKTQVKFSAIARQYLCPKKITIMNDDGSWTEIKVYDDSTMTWDYQR